MLPSRRGGRSCPSRRSLFPNDHGGKPRREAENIFIKMAQDSITRFGGIFMATRVRYFSVGPANLDDLRRYIDNQEEHHRVHTFQEEYLSLLAKYRIEYEEAYVWD